MTTERIYKLTIRTEDRSLDVFRKRFIRFWRIKNTSKTIPESGFGFAIWRLKLIFTYFVWGS